MIATIWEVWNDRHGDTNKSEDVVLRCIWFIVEAATLRLFTHKPFFTCLLLSSAVFFLLFDYLVCYFLIRNKVIEVPGAHWFSYMGKSGVVDNLKFWRDMNPWLKLLVRMGYFGLALTLILL